MKLNTLIKNVAPSAYLAGVFSCILTCASLTIPTEALAALSCWSSDKPVRGETPVGPVPFINRSGALQAAKGGWELAVRSHGGSHTYAVWDRAKNKKVACNRVPNGLGGYNWTCTLEAVPCSNTYD